MNIQLINTGSELLLGRRLNTHAQWLGDQLARLGYSLSQQSAVDDSGPAIKQAVSHALLEADLIITTGGLGPTSDDRTRDLIAELVGRPLVEDPEVLARIEAIFKKRLGRPVPTSSRTQAQVPSGATVLINHHGTAPGLVLDVGSPDGSACLLVMLPGPPRELCPMFEQQVAPILRRRFPTGPFAQHVFRTTGLGESFLEEKIAGSLTGWVEGGMELAYCARPAEVEVRLSMRGDHAQSVVSQAATQVRSLVGEFIFSEQDESLEKVVVEQLARRGQTVGLAESCTGGLLAHRLTNVPGASAVLLAGLVTYSNAAKQSILGVQASTLESYGAVSEETAREMVQGTRERLQSDFALSITGIAGPKGGTDQKPVGTVYIGLATAEGTTVQRYLNPYDRETFKWVTAQQALDLLRRALGHGEGAFRR